MSPPVGRPREFDEQEVLSLALATFWERGYEATSVNDLVEATGLNKGSLYQAFGDKHSLFLRTLEDYLSRGRLAMEGRFASEGTLKERFRSAMTINCSAKNGKRGCYAVNCLVELAPHDPEVKKLLAHHYTMLERIFEKALTDDRKNSERSKKSHVEPALLARILVTIVTGAAAVTKGHLDFGSANEVIAATLDEFL